jgi:small-conductance mechanosensitive channel
VRAINIRSTIIETPERAHVYVPNSAIMSAQFTNWTRNSRIVRRTLNIGAAYGSDTALVMRLLLQAATEQRHILKTPAPVVYLNNFGDSSLDFSMNVFIDDFNNAASAMSDLRLTVERLFSGHGIDIPFPQMALHMPAPDASGAAAQQTQPDAAPVAR